MKPIASHGNQHVPKTDVPETAPAPGNEKKLPPPPRHNLHVKYTRDEYQKLRDYHPDRSVLNDFLILDKSPAVGSREFIVLLYDLLFKANEFDLADYLVTSSGATSLNFRYQKIGPEDADKILRILKCNPTVSSVTLGIYDDMRHGDMKEQVANICDVSSLRSISLIAFNSSQLHGPELCSKIFDSLSRKTQLEYLSLNGFVLKNTRSGDGAENIGKLKSVLHGNPALTKFDLNNIPVDVDDAKTLAPTIANLHNLQHLELLGMNVTEEVAEIFSSMIEKIPALKILDLRTSQLSGQSCSLLLNGISKSKTLTALSFYSYQSDPAQVDADPEFFKHETIKALASHPTLRSLKTYWGSMATAIIDLTRSMNPTSWNLTSLELSLRRKDDASFRALADFLSKSPRLQALVVNNFSLNEDQAEYLYKSLKNNTNLCTLDFTDMPEGIESLSEHPSFAKRTLELFILIKERISRNDAVFQSLRAGEKWSAIIAADPPRGVPDIGTPGDIMGLLAQHVYLSEHQLDAGSAGERTDKDMLEAVLSLNHLADGAPPAAQPRQAPIKPARTRRPKPIPGRTPKS